MPINNVLECIMRDILFGSLKVTTLQVLVRQKSSKYNNSFKFKEGKLGHCFIGHTKITPLLFCFWDISLFLRCFFSLKVNLTLSKFLPSRHTTSFQRLKDVYTTSPTSYIDVLQTLKWRRVSTEAFALNRSEEYKDQIIKL